MRPTTTKSPLTRRTSFFLLFCFILLLTISCTTSSSEDEKDLERTETAIVRQQTKLAKEAESGLQSTIDAQQATINAKSAPPVDQPPTPDLAATQVALSVQQTLAAQPSAPSPQPPASSGGEVTPPTTAPVVPPAADFETQMKSASILLYEDIVNRTDLTRYVKKTLDGMNLNYKDDGSAKGWLKNDLLGGAPNGKPWDLVILSIEVRGNVSGEYFDYINDVLDKGSSVIIEAWHLDAISEGTVSTILTNCGVQVYPYYPKTRTVNDLIVWPLGNPSPVISEPNSGFRFTNVVDTWIASGDLGSLMALTGQGDAQLLLGTNADQKNRDGALAVCMGGQLTLQTFSSHSLTQQTMLSLWENYIYNALKVRLSK